MRTFIARLSAFSIAFVTCIFLLSGCSSSKSAVGGVLNLNTDLKLNFIVDGSINPDENKRPSPVSVRLYELKSPAVFAKADFIDLYERDKEVLAADLMAKQNLKTLIPGVNRTENLVLKSGANQIGLYVEFSQYRGSVNRVVFPITLNNVTKNEVTVKISGTEISIVKK